MEKRQSLQQVKWGKMDSNMSINETRALPHPTYKNKLKMV